MASSIQVEIVSAEGHIYSGNGSMVVASAQEGEIGVTPGHIPFISGLKPGEIRVIDGENEESFYVSGGIIEVQPKCVTVLSDTCVRAEDLDEAEAERSRQRAEEMLKDKQSSLDYAQAQRELAESVAQIAAIRKLKQRRR